LTSFHARIVPLVQAHGGVVDKFLGDGVMATFGAVMPSRTTAADALRALDAIMEEAGRWQKDLSELGVTAKLAVNRAAAAGTVVFATLGNDDRLEYTVIGDAVNLAAKPRVLRGGMVNWNEAGLPVADRSPHLHAQGASREGTVHHQ